MDGSHDFGNDEVDVGVSLAGDMDGSIDGDRADTKFDARTMLEIEPSQMHVVADAIGVFVVDEEARRGRELLRCDRVRRRFDEIASDLELSETARRPRGANGDRHGGRRELGRRRRRSRFLDGLGVRGSIAARRRPEDNHVFYARPDRFSITAARAKRGSLGRFERGGRKRLRRVGGGARSLDDGFDATRRVDDELQEDLDFAPLPRFGIGGGDRRKRFGGDDLRVRSPTD